MAKIISNRHVHQPPSIGGKVLALVLALALVSATVAIPLTVHKPAWQKAELVSACWLVVLWITFSVLLATGAQVEDDVQGPGISNRPIEALNGLDGCSSGGTGCDGCSGCSPIGDLGGCASEVPALLVVVAVIVAVLALGFVMWEVLFPLLGLGLLMGVRFVLQRVRESQGHGALSWPSAIWHGGWWACVAVVPVGLVIWVAHVVMVAMKLRST